MKDLMQRNVILATIAIAAFVALAATGYALAVDHGSDAVAPQVQATMMIPF
jgi:hypothetical protein